MKAIIVICLWICCLPSWAVGENTDSCLIQVPLELRYKGENLEKFLNGIDGVEAVSFVELLKNWPKLSFSVEEQQRILDKVEGNISQSLFAYIAQEVEKQDRREFSDIYSLLKFSQVPVRSVTLYNLDYIRLKSKGDVEGLITKLNEMVQEGLCPGTMIDWVALGHILEYVLDKTDLIQSRKMFEISGMALKQHPDRDFLPWKKARENFEGKIMLMEMGEE